MVLDDSLPLYGHRRGRYYPTVFLLWKVDQAGEDNITHCAVPHAL